MSCDFFYIVRFPWELSLWRCTLYKCFLVHRRWHNDTGAIGRGWLSLGRSRTREYIKMSTRFLTRLKGLVDWNWVRVSHPICNKVGLSPRGGWALSPECVATTAALERAALIIYNKNLEVSYHTWDRGPREGCAGRHIFGKEFTEGGRE